MDAPKTRFGAKHFLDGARELDLEPRVAFFEGSPGCLLIFQPPPKPSVVFLGFRQLELQAF